MRAKSLVLVLTLALAIASHAAVATFDDLPEGSPAASLRDGGITFSDLSNGDPSNTGNFFAVDASSGVYDGAAGYSAPNILTFNAYAPGEEVSFGQMKSFDFTTGALASSAAFTVLSIGNDPDSTLTLEGLRNGAVVGSTTLALTTDYLGVQNLTLGGGIFDSFHVDSSAPDGVLFVGLDNVTVSAVPEPGALALLGLGASGLWCLRARRS